MAENIKDLGKVCITPEGAWDANKRYERLALVTGLEPDPLDPAVEHLMSYISRQNVPPGIRLNNELYWQKFTNVVKFEDLYVGEDGWLYIGDTPIYQITLNDVLGDIVVDKIEQGLTDKIMEHITAYMSGVVSDFIIAITNQINRLITNGIKVNNQHSGGIEVGVVGEMINNNNNTHSGAIGITHNGVVGVEHSGQINVEGNISSDHPVVNKYTVTVNTTPSDAIVTIDGSQTNTKEVNEGSTVNIVVSKNGYVTATHIITNISKNETVDIELQPIATNWYFDIEFTTKRAGANNDLSFGIGVWSTKDGVAYPYTRRIVQGASYIQVDDPKQESYDITLKENTSTSERVIKIEFEQDRGDGSENKRTLVITQSGKAVNPTLTFVSPKSNLGPYNASGDTEDIQITSTENRDGSVTILGFDVIPNKSWIHGTVNQNGVLSVTVDLNNSEERSGEIVLKQKYSNDSYTGEQIILYVTQNGQIIDYYISPAYPESEYAGPGQNSLIFDNNGYRNIEFYIDSYKIINRVKYPVDFDILDDPFNPNHDWVTISNPILIDGDNAGYYKILVSVNNRVAPVNDTRHYSFTIQQKEGSNKSFDFYVKQGIWYDLTFGPFVGGGIYDKYEDGTVFNFDANGDEKDSKSMIRLLISSLRSMHLTPYTIEKPDWVALVQDYPNVDEFDIVVTPNTGAARSGLFKIIQTDVYGEGGTKTLTYTFNQDEGSGPQPPTDEYVLEVSTSAQSFDSSDGNAQREIVSTLNGSYNEPNIVSSDSWLNANIIDVSGTKYLKIIVTANDIDRERTGTITITNGDKSKTITVSQAGQAGFDTLGIVPSEINFNAQWGSTRQIEIDCQYDGNPVQPLIDMRRPDWLSIDNLRFDEISQLWYVDVTLIDDVHPSLDEECDIKITHPNNQNNKILCHIWVKKSN